MAFSQEDLRIKINKLIDKEIDSGHTIVTSWMVNLLITQANVPKQSFSGKTGWKRWDERDEAILVLREGYRQIVGAIIRKRKGEEEKERLSPQLIMPGFKRLQKVYSILRKMPDQDKPQEMLVPIGEMTLDECMAKVKQLKGMRKGLDIHIAEMIRYIKSRWPGSLAA